MATWSGAHREPLQRPAPAPSSGLESGSPGAGGRRWRRRRRHPPPPAPSSSASLLPPLTPPPRAPHGPLCMAPGREPGTARPAESVLWGRTRDRGYEREGPRAAGPGAGTQSAAAGGAGGEQQPQALEPHRAPACPPCVPSPEQQQQRRRRRWRRRLVPLPGVRERALWGGSSESTSRVGLAQTQNNHESSKKRQRAP